MGKECATTSFLMSVLCYMLVDKRSDVYEHSRRMLRKIGNVSLYRSISFTSIKENNPKPRSTKASPPRQEKG